MSRKNWLLKQAVHWWPPIFWAVGIFWLSSQSNLPGLQVSIYEFLFKKTAHIGAYALLYFLTLQSMKATYPSLKPAHWKIWSVPFLLCLLYAFSDELHQYFVPNRTATFKDVGYDFIGMSLVFLRQYRYI